MRMKQSSFFLRRCIWGLGMICFSVFIVFVFSNQNGSLSNDYSDAIAGLLRIERMDGYKRLSIQPWIMGYSLRDCGHMALYALIGLITFVALPGKRYFRKALLSVVFCLVVSCVDEYHQIFVPGRSGQVEDLILDAMGYGTVIWGCWFICYSRMFCRKIRSGGA